MITPARKGRLSLVGKRMSGDSNAVNLDYLENNVFLGLDYKGVKVYLSQIALETNNIINGVREVVIIGSDKIAPYMNIERRGDDRPQVEVSFDIPYSLIMSDEAILKFAKPEVDYKLFNLPFPESFSFGLIIKISPAVFTHRLEWVDDRMGLIHTVFAAAFNFAKRN